MAKVEFNKYGAILFLTGFAALTYEIVFIKTLSLFLGQSIYAFSVMLAAFMFGIGIGSLLASKLKGEALWIFALTQLGIAAYSIIFIPLLNKISVPAFYVSTLAFFLKNVGLIFLSIAILIIPTSLMGLSFPVLLRHAVEEKNDKKQIGQLFAYNTLGGLLGSLSAGFIFLPEFGVSASLLIAAVINLSVAVSLKTKFLIGRTAAVISLLIIALSINLEIDPHSIGSFYNASPDVSIREYIKGIETNRKNTEVLYSDFDVYGHVCVFKSGDSKFLYINGKADASTSTDITTQLMIGYIPMLLHENPEKVAIVGLGCGLTARAVQEFDIENLDIYEINPAVIEANKYFIEESNYVLQNPKTKIIVGDARRKLSLSSEVYDVIISEPSNPWVEGEGFLFTKEYYDIIDKRLSEKGIFVQWIGSYDYTEEAFNILLHTLHTKFPYIQLWSEGTDFYIITSRAPRRFNYSVTLKHINEPTIKADMELMGFINRKQLSPINIFFSYYITDYKETGETRINTDDNSIIEFSTGRFSGKSVPHAVRLSDKQMKSFPVDLSKNDLDIKFNTNLPLIDSKYSFIQTSVGVVITKQLVFRNKTDALFVQTMSQPEKPTLDQAKRLAQNFNASVTESDDHLYNLESANSNGIIGYCTDRQQAYLLFSTSDEQVNASCKQVESEQ
jgi:predicted membrane-bound spermidine synthase